MTKIIGLGLLMLFMSSILLLYLPPVEAQSTTPSIRILKDGSVDPSSAPVSIGGNVYTLTDNVVAQIMVDKDYVVVDGAGHTLSGGGVRLNQSVGVTIKNLVIIGAVHAFDLYKSSYNIFEGNTIEDSHTGFYLWISSWNNITENRLVRVGIGFNFIDKCPNNVIKGNLIQECGKAMDLKQPNNTFSDNTVTGCSSVGLLLTSGPNVLRNNTLSNNKVNFDVNAFNNEVDELNTVNGKPIIFWTGHRDETVPSNAGYVVLVDCNNIQVRDLEAEGIAVFSTWNSSVTRNRITQSTNTNEPLEGGLARYIDLGIGIRVIGSQKDNVSENRVFGKDCGIKLSNSAGIYVVDNNVTGNRVYGVLLESSNDNIVEGNQIAGNGFISQAENFGASILDSSRNRFVKNNVEGNLDWGIRVLGTQRDNLIFHNNFINNKGPTGSLQVSMMGPVNPSFWDDGERGNYWSDYITRYPGALEVPGTGAGDTPFYINENNIDNHPLMAPYNISAGFPTSSLPTPLPTPNPSPTHSESTSISDSPSPSSPPTQQPTSAPPIAVEPPFVLYYLFFSLIILLAIAAIVGIIAYSKRIRVTMPRSSFYTGIFSQNR